MTDDYGYARYDILHIRGNALPKTCFLILSRIPMYEQKPVLGKSICGWDSKWYHRRRPLDIAQDIMPLLSCAAIHKIPSRA